MLDSFQLRIVDFWTKFPHITATQFLESIRNGTLHSYVLTNDAKTRTMYITEPTLVGKAEKDQFATCGPCITETDQQLIIAIWDDISKSPLQKQTQLCEIGSLHNPTQALRNVSSFVSVLGLVE
jgi:hypothetical protein